MSPMLTYVDFCFLSSYYFCRLGQKTLWRWSLINFWTKLKCLVKLEGNVFHCANTFTKVYAAYQKGKILIGVFFDGIIQLVRRPAN